jgi:amidophosphoribosyltransferase
MGGIIAACRLTGDINNENSVYRVFRGMQLLQHRGKAYWKISSGKFEVSGYGSLPAFDIIHEKVLRRQNDPMYAIVGHLSKKKPKTRRLEKINFALDGFFIDLDKLLTHPLMKRKNFEPLNQIHYIFRELLIEREDPYKAAEFLDRHLRGNYVINIENEIYVFRNSTGFKPLFLGKDKNQNDFVITSENYIGSFFPLLNLTEINPGQLIRINPKYGIDILTQLDKNRILMDPFEFIRESHVSSVFNDKSIYSIRKNIGNVQGQFLSNKIADTDIILAEPDYTRPMALGLNQGFKNNKKKIEMIEGIIKDRYDDSDPMIDYSEQVSKNKLLSNGKTLKFIIEPITNKKKILSVQGTIQTGGTIIETVFYLKKSNVNKIHVLVSYVPTVDGRQVGLYTQQKDLIIRKYIGKISYIDDLNKEIASELGVDSVFYNSPEILAKGIGIHESQLWFPEWIRFLDYK